MKVNNLSYPHPVLGNGDDIVGGFSWSANCQIWTESVSVFPIFHLEHEWLAKLIRNKDACFTLEAQCGSTFYRKSFECLPEWERIDFPSESLRGKVELWFFICSKSEIQEYKPEGMHPDYGDCTFSIAQGDVLAVGGEVSFIADKDFDPMKPPAGTLMQIWPSAKMSGPTEIVYDKKIQILLSKEDWKHYSELPKGCEDVLHWTIVFPVLLDALYEWKKGDSSDFCNYEWFDKIGTIINQRWLNGREPFEMAQRILEYPISRALFGIDKLLVNEDSND